MEPLHENISGRNELHNITDRQFKEDDNMRVHPQHWCGQYYASHDSATNVYNYSNQDDKEKSAMCRIAEIAKFNKLRHVYDLLDESGPAHKKLFTVKLILNQVEVYEGSGSSIKRAQQAAAEVAIEKTKLTLPPEKTLRRRKSDVQPPHRILQNVCRTLHFADPVFQTVPVSPGPPDTMMQPNPFQCYPSFIPVDMSQPPNANNNRPKSYHASIVNIGGKAIATGFGPSMNLAKMDAASKALCILSPTLQEHYARVNAKNGNFEKPVDENDIPRYKRKSVISDVHERAHQMKTKVIFEVLREEGPPHDRQYLVRCAFVDNDNKITAEASGEGRKKKEAQQEACSLLLQSLKEVVPDNNPLTIANNLCKTQKKLASMTRDTRRKTIVKDKKMDPHYGHQINPVSRLIQIIQTKNNEHPVFELIGEHGHSRYKEFVIRVTCGNESCEGKGPNKRLAKRSAAESMLAALGYIKPLPEPGKSLLKKRSIDMDIAKDKNDSMSSQRSSSDVSETNFAKSPDSMSEHLHEGNDVIPQSEDHEYDPTESPESGRRRVTFNNQVQACPPPGDQNYPNTFIAPLKMDVIFEGKIRRIRRIKESRRSLTAEQKAEIAEMAKVALELIENKIKTSEDGKEVTAVTQLETISTKYKFGVQYTAFPKDGCEQNFSLVSLGFEDPAVCHGVGSTAQQADESAAFAALQKLILFDSQAVSTSEE